MKIIPFLFTIFITLFIAWVLGWLFFATSIAMAEPETGKEKTSAIVVLTGGNGRITEGLTLLSDNLSEKIFISGVNENTTQKDIRKIWEDAKIKGEPCCIHLGKFAETTEGNASETLQWIEMQNDIQSIRLVTSSYHMPRAAMLMKRYLAGKEIDIIEHPVFTPDFEPWKGRFWSLSFSEYNKWLVTKFLPTPKIKAG